METLGIYVQIPFCSSKCTFCNFSSRVGTSHEVETYFEALRHEIMHLDQLYSSAEIGTRVLGLAVDSIYFGGGTPTRLGAERLEELVRCLREAFRFRDAVEFTVEAAPGSADGALFESLRLCGVNRLSIGAQTFDNRELRAVGRLHQAEDTRCMAQQARSAGFQNISLDLVAGLPYQTEASWRGSIHSALSLEPEHLSVYLFEVDEKSRLGNELIRGGDRYGAPSVPGEEFMAWAYEYARAALEDEGYAQYEISNFARPGSESRHNRKYWRLQPYLGLGAGAHSFDGRSRWSNVTNAAEYGEKIRAGESPIENLKPLSRQEQIEEFFFLGLRQREGVDLREGERRWGREGLGVWAPAISKLQNDGLIEQCGHSLRLPEQAYLISNEIFERFLV